VKRQKSTKKKNNNKNNFDNLKATTSYRNETKLNIKKKS